MGSQTAGFDAIYEIDSTALLGALEKLVVDPVAMRLAALDLDVLLPTPAPPNTVQHGRFSMLSQPAAFLDLPESGSAAPDVATLTIAFPATLLQLDAVPATAQLADGVGALVPTHAGQLTVTLGLRFDTQSGALGTQMRIVSAPAAVHPPTPLPDLSALSNTLILTGAVDSAIAAAVGNALATLFPIAIDVPLGGTGPCNIGPRSLAVKLLPSSGGMQAGLGFFLTLQDGSQGDLSGVTQSNLGSGVHGAFAVSNAFLRELLCCLLRMTPGITGLPEPQSDTGDGCCHWRNVHKVNFGTTSVTVDELDICIASDASGGPASFTVHVLASQHGTGWDAYAQLDLTLGLELVQALVQPYTITQDAKTWSHVSAWVWVLVGVGAVIGFFVGGVPGALAGGAIGFAVSGAVYLVLSAIGSAAANVIGGALGALPADLTGTQILPQPIGDSFGSITDLSVLDFDDLMVGGFVRVPARANVYHEGSDIVLLYGDRIDLDRGVVQHAGESLPGFAIEGDLAWLPARPTAVMARIDPRFIDGAVNVLYGGDVVPLGTARLLPVGGTSFWSLTESALSALAFPSTAVDIDGATIPVSDTPYPDGARVFAVRTTDARLAKCTAWRDSADRLHLSYVTYNTPVPLAIASQVTTTLGNIVSTSPVGPEYEVAHTDAFTAISRGFTGWPPFQVQYQWLWNDAPLDGTGQLSDGTTQYRNLGSTLILETAMGTSLRGVLQVEQIGTSLVATVDVDQGGVVRRPLLAPDRMMQTAPTTPPSPPPSPVAPPLIEQLHAAFARTLGVPRDQVRFR